MAYIRDTPLGLVFVMSDLYADEINCGCESFWDSGFRLWLGDELNGFRAEMTFYPDAKDVPNGCLPLSQAGNWLHREACRAFPGWREPIDYPGLPAVSPEAE